MKPRKFRVTVEATVRKEYLDDYTDWGKRDLIAFFRELDIPWEFSKPKVEEITHKRSG